jgi:hypothetical protein
MTSLLIRGCTLGLAVLVLAASSLNAREPGAALDVRTATGETTFHIGERIALNMRDSLAVGHPGPGSWRPMTEICPRNHKARVSCECAVLAVAREVYRMDA